MARVTAIFLSGTTGNLITYLRMGKSCSRLKRKRIKQTPATKKRGINFGIAQRAGKALRQGLKDTVPNPTDRSMQSRFSGAIAKWMKQSSVTELPPCDAIEVLTAFSFTHSMSFRERFKIPFAISTQANDTILISLPSFVPAKDIKAQAGTVSIKCTFSVAGCMLQSGEATGSQSHSFTIPYNNTIVPAQVLEFAIAMPSGSLTVTGARLDYYTIKGQELKLMNNPAFMPAGVVDARYR